MRAQKFAIVGLGCRFPGGCNDANAFWSLLRSGTDAVSDIPKDRFDIASLYDPDYRTPGKIHQQQGGFVDGIADFDAAFFGMSPKEAVRVDPQQRMLLECAHQALEDAGIPPFSLGGSPVGVFVGISGQDYAFIQLQPSEHKRIGQHNNQGGAMSIAANRISYTFDLRGPSFAVDTACSSTLYALHLAVSALRAGDCNMALVGGVNAILIPGMHIGFSKGMFLSARGRCQAFSAHADGYVRSEGAGMIALKPLEQALADGNRIYAVVVHSGVNEDGRTDGMALPSFDAQAQLLEKVYRDAGLDPSQVGYVEAHGTGTSAGDSIEARALGSVLGKQRAADRPCLVGSVKTNIGHLEAGAGAAGLIKLALSLYHRELPRSLHSETLNPKIPFDDLHISVVRAHQAWPTWNQKPLAGINSFGFGGANAHAVLEAAPEPRKTKAQAAPGPMLVTLSARSEDALRALASRHLQATTDDVALADIAYSTAHHRDQHGVRAAIFARDKDDWRQGLTALANGEAAPRVILGKKRATLGRVAFVCSGQGPQWWAMGRQLFKGDAVFRNVVLDIEKFLEPLARWSLIEEVFERDEADSRIDETWLTQPGMFALQVGLCRSWQALGLEPEAFVGHSVGEVAAAVLSGALTLEQGVFVIYHRSRIQNAASGAGKMLAVGLSENEAKKRIARFAGRVSIAAINRPELCTVAGDAEPIDALASELAAENVFHKHVQVRVPFHSHHMDPLRDALIKTLGDVHGKDARLPMYSTVTGARLRGPDLMGDYWFRNVRQPVRFVDAIRAMLRDGYRTFVELSPHPILSPGIDDLLREKKVDGQVVGSLKRGDDDIETLHKNAAQLSNAGHPLSGPKGRFVPLPTYPWQRQRYWNESEAGRATRVGARVHPVVSAHQAALSDTDTHQWDLGFDARVQHYLADHIVQGQIVVPGAALFEVVLACGRSVFGEHCHLRCVEIERPLFLPSDGAEPPHVRLEMDGDDGHFRLTSRQSEGEVIRHVRGYVEHRGSRFQPKAIDVAGMQARCEAGEPIDKMYTAAAELGLTFGPSFKSLSSMRWALGAPSAAGSTQACLSEGICRIEMPGHVRADGHLQHPILMDGCFQSSIGAIAALPGFGYRIYLPVRFGALQLYSTTARQAWGHCRIKAIDDQKCIVDMWLTDDNGVLLGEIHDFELHRLDKLDARKQTNECSYEYRWLPQARAPSEARQETALLVGGPPALAHSLADQLITRGVRGIVTAAGDWKAALSTVQPAVCVCLVALDADDDALSSSTLLALHRATSKVLSELAIGLAGQRSPVRLVIVTHNAVCTERPRLSQAPSVGLGRVIANEYPKLGVRLVDLSLPDAAELATLADEIACGSADVDVALRGHDRLVLRVDRVAPRQEASRDAQPGDCFRLRPATPGVLGSLGFVQEKRHALGPEHVEVAVKASGLNFKDLMRALGLLPKDLSHGDFGLECSGVVTRVGSDVSNVQVGDEVMCAAYQSLSSFAVTHRALVVKKPAGLSHDQAASLPVAMSTAWYGLVELARIQAGETVLIHAATGGVGHAAIQIAQLFGAEIFATAGSDGKRDYLRSLGIRHVFDSRSLDWVEQAREATGGRGVDVVLNSLAGKAIPRGIDLLAPFGRFVEIGISDVYQNKRIGLYPFRENLAYYMIDLQKMLETRPDLLGSKALQPSTEQIVAGKLRPLPIQVVHASAITEAFTMMSRSQHTGKLVASFDDRQPISMRVADKPMALDAAGTYLVTGGTRGFGLRLGQFLVERGAKHLVLMSRSGTLEAGADSMMQRWREQGVTLRIVEADVGDEAALERALNGVRAELPPLRGIIHAAAVFADAALPQLDEQRFMAAFLPKAGGALNLDRLTRNDPIEMFVLLSSISSIVGNPGQGNYNAANCLLESLAWQRRADGRPATVINLGAIGDAGFVARNPTVAKLLTAKLGLELTSSDLALKLIERAIKDGAVQRIAGRFNWSQMLGAIASSAPRFALVAQASNAAQTGDDAHRLDALELSERVPRLVEMLTQAVARITVADASKLRSDQALTELGLDSLMVTQLSSWLQSAIGINVPTMRLLKGPTILQLGEELAAQLGSQRQTTAGDVGLDASATSCVQASLWADYKRYPGCITQSEAVLFEGPLDESALQRSFTQVLERHPLLRARFEDDGEKLRMTPMETPADAIRVVEMPDRADLRAAFIEEATRGFDLERESAIRVTLFHVGRERHVLHFTTHHMVYDAAVVFIIADELFALYRRECGLGGDELPAAAGYERFVQWEQSFLQGEQARVDQTYWHDKLRDSPLHLALGGPKRDDGVDCAMPILKCKLPELLTAHLRVLAKSLDTTLYTLLLTAYLLALRRALAKDDLVVGTSVSLRDLLLREMSDGAELQTLVGPVINHVALRTDLSGAATFAESVRRVSQTVSEALEHRAYPLHSLQSELIAPEVLQGRPRFNLNVNINFYDVDSLAPTSQAARARLGGHLALGDVRVSHVDLPEHAVAWPFDLSLAIWQSNGQLAPELRYNGHACERAWARRLLDDFVACLESAVKQSDARALPASKRKRPRTQRARVG